jgi:hypothetical protein
VDSVGAVLLLWRDGADTPERIEFGYPGVVVQGLDIDDSGTRLAVGRNDGRVEVWDFESLTPTGVAFTRHDREITDVAFAPSSAIAVSLDRAGVVWVWNADSGISYAQPIKTGLRYGRRIVVDREGTRVIVFGNGGVVTARLDVAAIMQRGCMMADLDPCPSPPPALQTVLRGE